MLTPADLKSRYPELAGIADGRVELILAEAGREVDESWIAADRVPSILALAAHFLVMDGTKSAGASPTGANADAGLPGAAPPPISQMKVGDVSVSFAVPRASTSSATSAAHAATDHHTTTPYGRRFLELRARSHPGVMVV